MLKSLAKANNCIFGLIQEARKVSTLYLAFENLIIRCKKSQQ